MRKDIAGPRGASSRPMWETLEGMVREKAQEFIQQIMEEEVTELLGPPSNPEVASDKAVWPTLKTVLRAAPLRGGERRISGIKRSGVVVQ